ncbi:MAG: hypothetical protein U7127_25340 [Phormidium sp.]
MAVKYLLQYHKYDELGHLPNNFIIHSRKACSQNALGDVVFLIVGGSDFKEVGEKIGIDLSLTGNGKKSYIFWQKFVIKKVKYLKESEEYEITGDKGVVFDPPILLNSTEFEEFRKRYSTSDLINISNASYLSTLLHLSGEKVKSLMPSTDSSQKYVKIKVKVPQMIYSNLEAVRKHKAIKMSDCKAVIQHAHNIGLPQLAKWIEANLRNYMIGTVNGFEPME